MKSIVKLTDIIILNDNNNVEYTESYTVSKGETVYWNNGGIQEGIIKQLIYNGKVAIITDSIDEYNVDVKNLYIEI